MRFIVQIVIKNEYGEFRGEKVTCNIEQYSNIIAMSKSFYSGGFEMLLEDDSFVVFPPEIVKRSILLVEKQEVK